MTDVSTTNDWVTTNLELLRSRYPELDMRVDNAVHWVRIAMVTLSTAIWTVESVEVAFRIPSNAGEAPYAFWVHPGVALHSGGPINNYTHPTPTPWGPDWGQFSFAPGDPWQPKADVHSGVNMLDFVRGIGRRLEEGA